MDIENKKIKAAAMTSVKQETFYSTSIKKSGKVSNCEPRTDVDQSI